MPLPRLRIIIDCPKTKFRLKQVCIRCVLNSYENMKRITPHHQAIDARAHAPSLRHAHTEQRATATNTICLACWASFARVRAQDVLACQASMKSMNPWQSQWKNNKTTSTTKNEYKAEKSKRALMKCEPPRHQYYSFRENTYKLLFSHKDESKTHKSTPIEVQQPNSSDRWTMLLFLPSKIERRSVCVCGGDEKEEVSQWA